MKKIIISFIASSIIPLLLFLILLSSIGGPNILAASATMPSKVDELLALKTFGIPYDMVMMITSYPCKTQKEADEARFIFIAMDFMVVTEEVEQIVCICPPLEATPEDPEPVGECTCENWEVVGQNTYTSKENILAYLSIDEENTTINCLNIEAELSAMAESKETDGSRYSIVSIASIPENKFETIIKKNGIVIKKDIDGIIELFEKGYFIEWLDGQLISGGVGTVPDLEGSKYIMPVAGPITSAFGRRIHPLTGKPSMHTGIDIGSAHYSSILSVYDGEVVAIGTDTYNGRYVLIYHEEDDFYSYYGHLSQWKVSVGSIVSKRQTIGIEGGDPDDPDPGWSTAHHLHFEIHNGNGQAIDPVGFLKRG